MKKKIITIVLMIIIASMALTSCDFPKQVVEITDIKIFKFSETNGYYYYGNMIYEVRYEDGVYNASIRPSRTNDDEILTIEIDKETINKIEEIMKKYDIGSWNGFQEYDDNVMDGSDFDLYVTFINDDYIEAKGYMKWPKNYHNFKEEISKLFDEIYESNRQ